MQSLTVFLREKLKLTVNPHKSAVDRPWKSKFLGFSLTVEGKAGCEWRRQAVERFKDKHCGKSSGRDEAATCGRSLRASNQCCEDGPATSAWPKRRGVFEDFDQWIRRKLRCMEWRKWKTRTDAYANADRLGTGRERAQESAFNGRGPWWNAGASHMNAALPTAYFRRLGLRLCWTEEVDWLTALASSEVFMNRRDTEPYVRWCGRTVRFYSSPPTRFP